MLVAIPIRGEQADPRAAREYADWVLRPRLMAIAGVSAVAGGVTEAVRRAKDAGIKWIICEVDRVDQIEAALAGGTSHLLCDNMNPAQLREAVALVAGRVPIEASGGVRLDTIAEIAATGVTYVSVGRLTQSAPAADIGLDFSPL